MNGNIANNFGSFDVVFSSGNGSTLKDVNGKEYIDFVSGIGVNCLGHNHPALVKTLQDQVSKQIHISNYYNSDIGLEYSKTLLAITKMDKIYFGNSGAEANEAAIKLARKYGFLNGGEKRKTIVALEKSFHGRTLATLCATGQEKFHPECFAPYPAGFKYIKANDYEAIKTAFDDTTCAFMLECVQGEGGVNLIDSEWAKTACDLARKAGAIVIADEVQTGFARTGTLFASEGLGIEPEIITCAKGIAGGVPMGACLYRGKADIFVSGDHQSTFGGNPLAVSAANTVLTKLSKPEFLARVISAGEKIRKTISDWNLPCVKNVRGKGLMIGIDIEQASGEIQKKCLENGLCVSTAGANTMRFLPPLVITDKEIEKGLEIFKSCLK